MARQRSRLLLPCPTDKRLFALVSSVSLGVPIPSWSCQWADRSQPSRLPCLLTRPISGRGAWYRKQLFSSYCGVVSGPGSASGPMVLALGLGAPLGLTVSDLAAGSRAAGPTVFEFETGPTFGPGTALGLTVSELVAETALDLTISELAAGSAFGLTISELAAGAALGLTVSDLAAGFTLEPTAFALEFVTAFGPTVLAWLPTPTFEPACPMLGPTFIVVVLRETISIRECSDQPRPSRLDPRLHRAAALRKACSRPTSPLTFQR